MKRIHRLSVLALALVMALSVSLLPAAAVDQQAVTEKKVMDVLQTAEDYKVQYIGGCKVTSGTVSADLVDGLFAGVTRAGNYYYDSGVAAPLKNGKVHYTCSTSYGLHCTIATFNDSTEERANMSVDYTGELNDEPCQFYTSKLEPQKVHMIDIDYSDKGRLDATFDGEFEAALGVKSVPWRVSAHQY